MKITTEHKAELEKEALQYLMDDKDKFKQEDVFFLKSLLLTHFAIRSVSDPGKYNIDLFDMYVIIDRASETFRSIIRTEYLLKGEK
ncbi:MAG: hypothetical protein MJZ37_08570 [Bacilli bacterium]|nr:hypothetical protein [Bacilli bacterium]